LRRRRRGRTRLEAGRRHEGTLTAKKPACATRRCSRMPRDSTATRRVVRGSNSMAGRLGEGETSGSRWTPGAGAIGDGGRHRTRTRRRGGGGTTRSDRRRGGLDGAWRSGVGAQGPTAWGGLELRFMRAHGRRHEVGQQRKRRGRGGATAALVADGSRRCRRRGGVEEQRRRCTGSGIVLRQRAWQLRTAPARTAARGRRTMLSGPIFNRTRGDGRAPPHSANEGATGGDTEADRRVPPVTISPI
jgi:hypothetical protein